jgi:sugar phosphate isomerase/epimerase
MAIQVGNASAPRWYDLSPARLDSYIDLQLECGATSTELVLHHGEFDEQIARVHVLEKDWSSVFEKFRAIGIVCHAHAPLNPRFNFSRWQFDPEGLQLDLAPVLRAVATFAERQGDETVLVVHGASDDPELCEEITLQAIDWVAEEFEKLSSAIITAIELRRPLGPDDQRFDRRRESLTEFVQSLGRANVGICWDLGNENSAEIDCDGPDVLPEDLFLELVRHVHLHDVAPDGSAHHPLCLERVRWREPLHPLIEAGYHGAITLEIRYRHALAQGEPWVVLADSYRRLVAFLDDVESESRPLPVATTERALA